MVFTPRGGAAAITKNLEPKAIQELFETEYGRMNAILGVEIPNTNGTIQTTIPYYFIDPATEIIVPTSNPLTPIGTTGDGVQLWKITHNGVDTHAIHFHMFNVQIVNRVGWDGAIRPPDANELGWKETVKMNPLEDCIVAIRAVLPINLPFTQPNSVRLMNPAKAVGSAMGFTGIDPEGNPAAVTNQVVNYGQEYVWHCHLLGHEENDMMRPLIALVAPNVPTNFTAVLNGTTNAVLTWTNPARNMTGFTIQRATNNTFTAGVTTYNVSGIVTTFNNTVTAGTQYFYRIAAVNVVGDTAVYAAPAVGYPNASATSAWTTNVVSVGTAATIPAAPTNLVATGGNGASIVLTWTDNANNETAFRVQRSTDGINWTTVTSGVAARAGTGLSVTYTATGGSVGTVYMFRVQATNVAGGSLWSNTATRTR
jgi:hypothetical protein